MGIKLPPILKPVASKLLKLDDATFDKLDKFADTIEAFFDQGKAKDDVVGTGNHYTFTIADLLKNDINAKANTFYFGDGLDALKQAKYMAAHGIVDNHDGTYTATAGVDFSYSVMTNKGLSEGQVDVVAATVVVPPPVIPPVVDNHILASWTFEDTAVTDARGWQVVNAPNGWQNVAQWAIDNGVDNHYSGTVEVVDGTHGPATGFGAGEHQWLDTAASPGNVWLQLSEANRTTNLAADHYATLEFSVAKQDLGVDGHTDPNAQVEFWWNYELVKTVKASDLADANKFYKFDAVVHGNDALPADQLFIKSSGQDFASQGLAIDHIVLHDGGAHTGQLLLSEGFEGVTNTTTWEAVDLGQHGWTNPGGNVTEVAYGNPNDGFAYGGLKAAEGNYWLDTQASPGSIDIKHDFVDPTGGQIRVGFDIASETIGTAAWQQFAFKVDGNVVGHVFDASELQWKGDQSDPSNYINGQMQHYEFVVDVGGPAGATHTLELQDVAGNSNTGFAVDNITIHDWIL